MVRCFVTSPNDVSRTVRYVPFDIYQLWKVLMEVQKSFRVSEECVSMWMDEELYSREAHRLPPHRKEEVMEISFVYYRESDVGRNVVRYFPADDYEKIMGYFLKNFSEKFIRHGKKEVPGVFVFPLKQGE
jgi:hypothetical protein